jgi:hypothetical protein
MAGNCFDAITKEMAVRATTRRGGALLGVAALGALLTRAGGEGAARCTRAGEPCRKTAGCCGGAVCRGNRKRRKCLCDSPTGFADCAGDGRCAHLPSDAANCGACGVACQAEATCCDGVCSDPNRDNANCGDCGRQCPAGQRCCGGTCAKTDSDQANCGACGRACGAADACCGGECIDVFLDPANCGTCGRACAPNAFCFNGECFDPLE